MFAAIIGIYLLFFSSIITEWLSKKSNGSKGQGLNKIVNFSCHLLFNIMYFDIQIVSLTELVSTKITYDSEASRRILQSSDDSRKSYRVYISYLFSLIFVKMTILELWKGYKLI
jgi:hypothetical protein